MQGVQGAVKDRGEHDARDQHKDQAAGEGVDAGEYLARGGVQGRVDGPMPPSSIGEFRTASMGGMPSVA